MAYQSGITGFARVPGSADPNKVYALGKGGRAIVDAADLIKATGATSVAEAWKLANVQIFTPAQAYSYGIRAAGINAPTPVARPAPAPAPAFTPASSTNNVSQWKQKWQNIKGITGFYRVQGQPTVYAIGPGGNSVGSEAELAWITAQTGRPLTANQVQEIPASQAAQYGIQIEGAPPLPGPTLPDETLPIDETSATGDAVMDDMIVSLQEYLDKLAERGQTIDPYVEITPEKMAEFLAQAEREIDPYYATQMGLAKESLLKSLGYTKDDLDEFEGRMEKQYGKKLIVSGETAADVGFARSGRREVGERELAMGTEEELTAARKSVTRGAEQAARTYAQLWGGKDMPTTQIGAAPRVVAGEAGFQRGVGEVPMYTLDDSIYQDLIGSRQWEQEAAKKGRVSELEKGYKTGELERRQRELIL